MKNFKRRTLTASAARSTRGAQVAVALCAALFAAGDLQAATFQSAGFVSTRLIGAFGNVTAQDTHAYDFLNEPAALDLNSLDASSSAMNFGSGIARVAGTIGSLRTFATASGFSEPTGTVESRSQAEFFDTLMVSGNGLAAGTMVSYRVDFSINGGVTAPVSSAFGQSFARGLASVRLQDRTSGERVQLNWDAANDAVGVFSLTLATEIGHELSISGSLASGVVVRIDPFTPLSATSDFFHTANYALAPSIAGLNTTGASGRNFLVAPPTGVPAPEAWGLLLLGLGAIATCARPRRQMSNA